MAQPRHFALSAIGRDRPGIVAALTGVLLEHGLNIEDSQMTILSGHFTVMLVVSGTDDLDPDRLRADLESAKETLNLEAVSVSEVHELQPATPHASHIVTVYGPDHPGIVHAVSSLLADRGVNITDLNTRLVAEEVEDPIYAMMLEVSLPGDMGGPELDGALRTVTGEQGVEITVRELDEEAL